MWTDAARRAAIEARRRKAKPAVDKILDHIKKFPRNPLNPQEHIYHGTILQVSKDYSADRNDYNWKKPSKDRLHLDFIKSLHPGKGVASKALDRLVKLADKNKVAISLFPSSVGLQHYRGLTTNQLKQWYGRHGFKRDKYGEWVHDATKKTRKQKSKVLKLTGNTFREIPLKINGKPY